MVLPVMMSIPSHTDTEEIAISQGHEEEAQFQVDKRKECSECQTEPLAKYATGSEMNTPIPSHIRSMDAAQYRGIGRQPSRRLRPRETERPHYDIPNFPEPEISGFLEAGRRVSSMIWVPAGKWSLYVDWLDGRTQGMMRSTFVLRLSTYGS